MMPNAQTMLSVIALTIMGGIGLLLVFFTLPPANKDMEIYILGALSGAVTGVGVSKIADRVTNASGANQTINQPAAQAEEGA